MAIHEVMRWLIAIVAMQLLVAVVVAVMVAVMVR